MLPRKLDFLEEKARKEGGGGFVRRRRLFSWGLLLSLGGCADLSGLNDLGGVRQGGAAGSIPESDDDGDNSEHSTGGASGGAERGSTGGRDSPATDSGGERNHGGETGGSHDVGSGGTATGGVPLASGGTGGSGSGGDGASGGSGSGGDGASGGSGGDGSGGSGGDGSGGSGGSIQVTCDSDESAAFGECWRLYQNTEHVDQVTWSEEEVVFRPGAGHAWFTNNRAEEDEYSSLYFQKIEGDFYLEARVSVTNAAGSGLPSEDYAGAALIVLPAGTPDQAPQGPPHTGYYAVKMGSLDVSDPNENEGVKSEFTATGSTQMESRDIDGVHGGSRIRICKGEGFLWTGYDAGGGWVGLHRGGQSTEPDYYSYSSYPPLGRAVFAGFVGERWSVAGDGATITFHDVVLHRAPESDTFTLDDCLVEARTDDD